MKEEEHKNFMLAYSSGAIKGFEDRWNKHYFHPLGLCVRIEPPGIGKTEGMDVASSKLFKYQQKMGTSSAAPGVASKQGDKKEHKYESKEGRYRTKAMRKGRIIVQPYNKMKPVPPQLRMIGWEGHSGQTEGVTTKARPSVQDFASLESLRGTPTTAQHLASSNQRQASSEGRYHGRSEDTERAPSPARAATTHWGGNH